MPESFLSSSRLEPTANLVFGLNVWMWAILGLTAPEPERFHVVRLCIMSLHVVVGALLISRRPMLHGGRAKDILAAVPAVVLSGVAFWHAPVCTQWGWMPQILFVLGTVLAIAAFLSLARNFSILPAVRGVTTSGPYRWVRHPAYLGETLLVLACCLAKPDLFALTIVAATVTAVAIRIRAEENLIQAHDDGASSAYARYCQAVPHRLIPSLW